VGQIFLNLCRWVSYLLFGLALISACQLIPGQYNGYFAYASDAIPSGYESYLDRPDILKIKPVTHNEFGSDWQNLKRAHLEATAQLLELYPDREIYFLARDSELLYDYARWALKDQPKALNQIHLLNVSRANMRADHISDYLSQEGISEKSLSSAKKFLFVDTGFEGTIPRVIGERFPAHLRSKLKTHLMCSQNANIPSTRVFLTALNPNAPRLDPGSMHYTIISYEHMPRYTNRSDRFLSVGGRWHPMSTVIGQSDGAVSKSKAISYMQDLLAYAEKEKSLFESRRTFWRNLVKVQALGDLLSLKNELSALFKAHPDDPMIEASIRDFIDIHNRANPQRRIEPGELKLLQLGTSKKYASKHQLALEHPEWASILEDPETGIKSLIQNGEYSKLGAILDTIKNDEFAMIVSKEIIAAKQSPELGTFVDTLIKNSAPDQVQRLVFDIPMPPSQKNLWLLNRVIDLENFKGMEAIASHTFTHGHFEGAFDLISRLIDKGNPGVFSFLSSSTFNQEFMTKRPDLWIKFLEKADLQAKRQLATFAFSQSHAVDMTDVLDLLISTKDEEILSRIVRSYFSKPYSVPHKSRLVRILALGLPAVHLEAARSVYSESHSKAFTDLLSYLINGRNPDVYEALKKYSFNKMFWMDTPGYSEARRAIVTYDLNEREELIKKYFMKPSETEVSNPPKATSIKKPIKDFVAITPSLQKDQWIRTSEGRILQVIERVDQGKRGVVFKVRSENAKVLFALKVSVDGSAETLKSFAKETVKEQLYSKYGVKHAKIIEAGPTVILKQWIDGIRADDWIAQWKLNGAPIDAPEFQKLQQMINSHAKRGVYIRDLNAKHAIWDGHNWVIVDSGGLKEGLSLDQVREEYLQALPNRWAKGLTSPHCEGVAKLIKQYLLH